MKIAFDIKVFSAQIGVSRGTYMRPSESERAKVILDALSQRDHELFVFVNEKCSEKEAAKFKARFLRFCRRSGWAPFKLAVLRENDAVDAVRRNHIDVFITCDAGIAEACSAFTDCLVCDEQIEPGTLIGHIDAAVASNRQPLIPSETAPRNLPSEDKLWLKHYRVGDLRWNEENLSPYDRLIRSNTDWRDEVALEFFGKTITYAEFFRRIDSIADAMFSLGIKKGVKVPLVVVNTPEAVCAIYALFKLKATVIPIFPLDTSDDMRIKLEKICDQNRAAGCGNTSLFIADIVFNRFKGIIPQGMNAIVLGSSDSMPKHMALAFRRIVMPKLDVKPIEYNETVVPFKSFLRRNAVRAYTGNTGFDDSYTAIQLYTGGTIKPKAVLLTEANIDSAAKQFCNDRFAFRRGDKIAAFMPLNHSFGLIIGTHVAASLGVDLDLIMKIDFKRLDKLFVKDKVNLFGGIPNMFPAIRNNERLKAADLSHVKQLLSGGSLLDDVEKRRTLEFFKEHNSKAEFHDGYGLTESAGGIVYNGIPNIGVDVKVVECGTDDELGYGEIGELCLSGKQIMHGYDEDSLNAAALHRHRDGKIWLHTGDNALIRENGIVEIVGRMDRMIKVNGEQVILDEIEELINGLPFVERSAVIKRSDPIRGFVPVAFIKPKPSCDLGETELKQVNALYEAKLTAFARPRETRRIDEFPLTTVGKVDFRALETAVESENAH